MFIATLTNDVVFKFVFGSKGSEEPLRALLNALLERGPDERIQQVEIINPGLGRDHLDDKAVVLDVRARDEKRGLYKPKNVSELSGGAVPDGPTRQF